MNAVILVLVILIIMCCNVSVARINEINSSRKLTMQDTSKESHNSESSVGTKSYEQSSYAEGRQLQNDDPLVLTTTFSGWTGQSGIMFNIMALKDLTIVDMDVHINTSIWATFVEVFTTPGTFEGKMTDQETWSVVACTSVMGGGVNKPTKLQDGIANVFMPKLTQRGFYITIISEPGVYLMYSIGNRTHSIFKQDANMRLMVGIGVAQYFSTFFNDRAFNGSVYYHLGNVASDMNTGNNSRQLQLKQCMPTAHPTVSPAPSISPTKPLSTQHPTIFPINRPSLKPSDMPSNHPSAFPTALPSTWPSRRPTARPSTTPTTLPSVVPTSKPSMRPSQTPSHKPSKQPSTTPSTQPTIENTSPPSLRPTNQPSWSPSGTPSAFPSSSPSFKPSLVSTNPPFVNPSALPSFHPSWKPTSNPSPYPSWNPSVSPSDYSTNVPSAMPTVKPTTKDHSRPPTGVGSIYGQLNGKGVLAGLAGSAGSAAASASAAGGGTDTGKIPSSPDDNKNMSSQELDCECEDVEEKDRKDRKKSFRKTSVNRNFVATYAVAHGGGRKGGMQEEIPADHPQVDLNKQECDSKGSFLATFGINRGGNMNVTTQNNSNVTDEKYRDRRAEFATCKKLLHVDTNHSNNVHNLKSDIDVHDNDERLGVEKCRDGFLLVNNELSRVHSLNSETEMLDRAPNNDRPLTNAEHQKLEELYCLDDGSSSRRISRYSSKSSRGSSRSSRYSGVEKRRGRSLLVNNECSSVHNLNSETEMLDRADNERPLSTAESLELEELYCLEGGLSSRQNHRHNSSSRKSSRCSARSAESKHYSILG